MLASISVRSVSPWGEQDTTSAPSSTSIDSHDTSFWQKVKDFFSVQNDEDDEAEHHADFRNITGDMGWSDERSGYYEEEVYREGSHRHRNRESNRGGPKHSPR